MDSKVETLDYSAYAAHYVYFSQHFLAIIMESILLLGVLIPLRLLLHISCLILIEERWSLGNTMVWAFTRCRHFGTVSIVIS